ATAAALGLWWAGRAPAPEAPPAATATAAVAGAWRGQVLEVERAFGSPRGLAACAPGAAECGPLAAGDPIATGTQLETDGLTRARVKLGDGSLIALDRQTRFELDAARPRRARLHAGNLVAEIEPGPPSGASAGAASAVIELPAGRAEVLGTKF